MVRIDMPTSGELREIARVETLAELKNTDDVIHHADVINAYEEQLEMISGAASVALRGYQSDAPGYVGDVWIIVWSGGPEMASVYIRDKNRNIIRCATTFGGAVEEVS